MANNEALMKGQLGLTNEKLEKIYNAYESGKMDETAKADFENTFPEFITRMREHNQNLDANSSDITINSYAVSTPKPKVDPFLSHYDPTKVAKIEDAYQSGKMDAASKKDYEAHRKEFISNGDSGADAKVRLAVGAESDPERKLAVVRHYHPEAVPFGSDNYLIKDKDGRNTLFNPEGLDVKDLAGAAPEIVGGVTGGLAALGTGGAATAIGLSAATDALFKNATQNAIREYMGNNNIEGIKPATLGDNLKEIGIDTAAGLAGGAIGHGLTVGAGKVLQGVGGLLRPLDQETAGKLVTILDNASPEMKQALKEKGLPLSAAYDSMAGPEGLVSKVPFLNSGLREAQENGGKLLTDSIQNKALNKAGMTAADLTGEGSTLNRAMNIADDIKGLRGENYQTATDSIVDQFGKENVPLDNFYSVVNDRLDKVAGLGIENKEANSIKRLVGFDFDKNPAPSYESLEEMTKRLRDNLHNSNMDGAERVRARALLEALQKDLDAVVPEGQAMRADYRDKSTALDMLNTRGGTNSANLAEDLTSPQTFVTKMNKMENGRGDAYSPKVVAGLLGDEKALAERLLASGQYTNTSNTAASSTLLNSLLGGAALGGGIGYANGDTGKGTAIGATAGLLGKSILIDQLMKRGAKGLAEGAIRRSATESALPEIIASLSNGAINQNARLAGLLGGEILADKQYNKGVKR